MTCLCVEVADLLWTSRFTITIPHYENLRYCMGNYTRNPRNLFHISCRFDIKDWSWGVLVLLIFSHFSPEAVETGSLGAKESNV